MLLPTLAALAAMTPGPIQLTAKQDGDATTFMVEGASTQPLIARYELEITGGTGNRNRNAGTATLRPGERHRFAIVRINDQRWEARLRVMDASGRQLSEEVLRSTD